MDAFVNLGSFLIQFTNICIIIFVLNKFLFKPYLWYLVTEEKKRSELETAHEKMEELKKDAWKEAKTIIESAKSEADSIKKQWELLAKQEATDIVENAKKDAEKIKNKAELDIENERKALYAELKWKVLDVALKLNEKLFSKSESNSLFIKKAIDDEAL